MIVEAVVRKYALKNALDHGKALPGAVVPKVIGEDPELKRDVKGLMKVVNEVVAKVNKMSRDAILKELQSNSPEMLEKKEEERGLPELDNSDRVVMRLAPFPSGDIHIGNIRGMIINDEYVKKYKGKLLLVIDDTIGSEEKPIAPEAYDLIPESIKWLGINFDKNIIYKSDRLAEYYKHGKELISKGKAYVCECPSELIRDYRARGIECDHRSNSPSENLKKWESMLKGKYSEGDACVRLKTDLLDKDPAFRDRVLFRVSKRSHPRAGNKYCVWPMLEMSWAVDDMLLGITHIIRGKELMIEGRMEEFIWNCLDYKNKPVMKHVGLFQVEGVKISKSKSGREVKAGTYSGWDDPRTWSVQSLKRRGFRPEALREFILGMGLSLAEIKVPVDSLYTINRRLIDPQSLRYFFVKNPVKLVVTGCPELKVNIPMHPKMDATRSYVIEEGTNEFFISDSDVALLKKEKKARLKDAMNIEVVSAGKTVKAKYARDQKEVYNIKKIQFVKPGKLCEVLREDGTINKGLCEDYCSRVKKGEIIQFERYGFVRKEGEGKYILTHP